MSKMNSVAHFEMPYEDRERMAKFYRTAFGWQTQMLGEEMGNYVLATTTETDESGPKKPGAINGGFFQKRPDWPAQHPSVVIAVDDVQLAMKKVAEAGGRVLGEPKEIPGVGQYVAFFDSEGNRVSMLQAQSAQLACVEVRVRRRRGWRSLRRSCLVCGFDSEAAEQAARFDVSVFPNARIGRISRYGKEGFEVHGRPEGSVMTVEVEIEGQEFTTLNGGPHFKFSEAISFQVPCESRGWVPLFRRRTQGHDPLTLTELCLDTRNMSTMQPINRRRPTAIGSRVPDSVRRHWLASDRNGADRQTPAKLIEGVPAAAPSV